MIKDYSEHQEFKKTIEDFVEKSFSGMGNGPVYNSLRGFKEFFPEDEYTWIRKRKAGVVYYEVVSKENNNIRFNITEHPTFK